MDKNTIWAIVLSTLVIVGSYFLLPMVFGNKNAKSGNQATVEVSSESSASEQNGIVQEQNGILTDSLFTEEEAALISENEEDEEQAVSTTPAVEKNISIDTGLAKITFTTKGGDIISYKLSNHYDKETQDMVELSDGITDVNRTCALAIGGAENSIINEIFNYEQPDPYTILFKKNLIIKDSSGKAHSYTVGKRYTFKQDEYMFKLEILIHSNDGTGLDFNGTAYTLRTSPQIGPRFNQKQNRYENRQFIAYNGKKTKKIILSNNVEKQYDKDFLWGGIAGKYFMELVIPTDSSIFGSPTYSAKVLKDDYANAQAMFERKAATQDIQDTYYMYFGPRDEKSLKIYNTSDKNAWGFGGTAETKLTMALQTSGMFSWLETILKFCLEGLHKVISNWGICIIVLTIFLKIILFPLSKKQSMSSLKMQELQPKIQAIQKKYANDQQKLQQETSKLYQEAGYNPAAGCLPMLFQFLVIIAMYNLFNNYFEFRGAMFIPKWIPDLTEGDSVYTFSFNIPLIGNTLRILPIIYVGSQILSGWITQKMNPPTGQSEKTMKFMTYGMPFMFFFIFYNAPSGLLLYWLTSNILQLGQQAIINKMMAKKRAEAGIEKTPNVPKNLPPKAKAKQKK